MRGATGAVAAWSGFLILPFCVMLLVSLLYAQFGDLNALRRALAGIAAAAAGLMISTFAKMARPLFRSFGPAPFVLLAVAGAIGVLRWPLLWVLLVAAPLSVALAWWRRR
jgi:chromate transporter